MNKTIQNFQTDGYVVIDDLLSADEVAQIDRELDDAFVDGAGDRRFLDREWCRLLAHVVRHRLLKLRLLYLAARPIACTYFAKTRDNNWSAGLHRDLHVPLAARTDAGPWMNWSEKQGIAYAQAPRDVLAGLLVVRINLDDCSAGDSGLCVVRGSQSSADVEAARVECTGPAGSAVVMSPLVLHASVKSTSGRPRRVLHFAFGPKALPHGAHWYYQL